MVEDTVRVYWGKGKYKSIERWENKGKREEAY
jgi:hypothetical protein